MTRRLFSCLAVFLFFVALPVSAEEGHAKASIDTMSLEVSANTATDVDTATVADSEIAESTEPAMFDILEFLELTSPVLEAGYNPYPGYCYHDCSTCYSRDDCIEPGFPIGFPCTEIPLC